MHLQAFDHALLQKSTCVLTIKLGLHLVLLCSVITSEGGLVLLQEGVPQRAQTDAAKACFIAI